MSSRKCNVTFEIVKELQPNQVIGVVGGTGALGCWKTLENAIILQNSTGEEKNKWSATVRLEKGKTHNYRYFQANVVCKKLVVTSWDALEDPRTLVIPNKESHVVSDEYGENLSCGWLTGQSELRIYMSSCAEKPFLRKSTLDTDTSQLKMKVSANPVFSSKVIKLRPCESEILENTEETCVEIPGDDSGVNHTSFVFQYWKSCNRSINAQLTIINGNEEVVGTATFSTCSLNKSKGTLCLPVIKEEGRAAVAEISVGYAVIHSFSHKEMNLAKSQNIWDRSMMLLVGHRGCGNSFTSDDLSNYRENSVESFKKVSDKAGAFIEFDVHLTKDSVPIVYHDLTTCLQTSKRDGSSGLTEVPVHQLLLEEVQTIRTKHRSRRMNRRSLAFDENDFEVNPPFPTLAEVFAEVSEYTGFNIELKYPSLNINGRYEDGLRNYVDANHFLDQILQVVYDCGEDREIFFSSFDVDICIMARKKQNRYPVYLLTNGNTTHYTAMLDLRERSNEMALATAKAEGFAGINSLEKDLYEFPDIVEKVHKAGLMMAFYGDGVANNLPLFDEKNVDIAIYDRIHKCDYTPHQRKQRRQEEE